MQRVALPLDPPRIGETVEHIRYFIHRYFLHPISGLPQPVSCNLPLFYPYPSIHAIALWLWLCHILGMDPEVDLSAADPDVLIAIVM